MDADHQFKYRKDIDGLRAVAVVVVVLYHAGFSCPGGYVGVDVFFVISGFLITSLLWRDLRAEKFSFAHFWERRARRIAPALVVVVAATLIGGWFVLLPHDFEMLARAAVSQAVFAANVFHWLESGYFAAGSEELPLLHTWSLAVEEQFYFVMPVILWGVYRKCAGLGPHRVARVVVVTGLVLSLGLSVVTVARFSSSNFFLLPTRAWELFAGALLVFVPGGGVLRRRITREIVAALGIGLILFPVFAYNEATLFPGLTAVPPCLGTAILIWLNIARSEVGQTFVHRLLSLRGMVFVGLISYSLYLWHWPLLVYGSYLSPGGLPTATSALLVLGSVLLATLSWRYVETPFRRRNLGRSRIAMFAYAGGGLGAIFVLGMVILQANGFGKRFPPDAVAFAETKADVGIINELTTEDIRAGNLLEIGNPNAVGPPAVLIWGDSHAMSVLPAFDALLKEQGLKGCAATHSATAPVLDWYLPHASGLAHEAPEFAEEILHYIGATGVRNVVLHCVWADYVASDSGGEFCDALLKTSGRLQAIGVRVHLMLDTPGHPFHPPRVLSRHSRNMEFVDSLCSRPEDLCRHDRIPDEIIARLTEMGVEILDPKPEFLAPEGGHYLVRQESVVLYRDNAHLTTLGAKRVILPFLRRELSLLLSSKEVTSRGKPADTLDN